MRGIVLAAVVGLVLVACHRQRVVYEYEDPVTITSGAAEPDLFTPTTTTTPPPAPPSVWRRGSKQ